MHATSYSVDSLKSLYGLHKKFIPHFELQSLIALAGYPELKNDFITFKYASLKTCGQTVPAFFSVFKRYHRHYIININNTVAKSVLLNDAPFNAQVGVFAHELAHVADYKNRNLSDLMKWAFNYMFKSKRAVCEKATDKVAIEHGFGQDLYEWIFFVLNNSNATDKYKAFKRHYYLQPQEIKSLLTHEEIKTGSGL